MFVFIGSAGDMLWARAPCEGAAHPHRREVGRSLVIVGAMSSVSIYMYDTRAEQILGYRLFYELTGVLCGHLVACSCFCVARRRRATAIV